MPTTSIILACLVLKNSFYQERIVFFLTKLLKCREGVRNFIFYNRHAGNKQPWLSVK